MVGAYYRIEEKIGQGGMATVYRTRHTVLDSLHAIKVLQPHLAADRDLRLRFLEEGRIQAGMGHPHVLPVTDLINEPGCAGLVMRWLDGHDLRGRLESGPVSLEEGLTWTLQTLSALAHVHEQGVIHRDLKPENLFLERIRGGHHLQVMDFGIAKVVDKQRTRTGVAMGSLCYMSPEQIRDPRTVDHRSDLFAMGAILYELVTGRPAFDAETDFEVMTRITEGRFEPLEDSLPNAPVLSRIISRAMAVDRTERFENADAFAEALRTIQRTDLRTERLSQLQERAEWLGLDVSKWWVPRDVTDEWLDGASQKLDELALTRQSALEEKLVAAQGEISRLTQTGVRLDQLRRGAEIARSQISDLHGKLAEKTQQFDDMAEARRMTMLELDSYEERLLHTLGSEKRQRLIIGGMIALGLLGMMFSWATG